VSGLVEKILRETAWIAGLFGLALFAVTAILTFVLPQVQGGFDEIFAELPFAKKMVGALLGTDIGRTLSSQMLQAMLFVHPVVLTITWSFVILFGTRVPAGEIDRGTADVLMSWPVSRRTLFATESALCLVAGLWLIALAWLGHLSMSPTMPVEMRPRGLGVVFVYVNFFAVYVAVAGMTFLVSALSERRGRAVAAVGAFLLFSFLLNFVAPFWEPAKSVDFLSVLTYYRPATILSEIGFTGIRILPYDFVFPPLPKALLWAVQNLSLVLENMPYVRNFAGELYLHGQNPAPEGWSRPRRKCPERPRPGRRCLRPGSGWCCPRRAPGRRTGSPR